MPKPNFRVVDSEQPHSRDIARKAVKRFRTLVEQERLPISNQICTGAPSLWVDDVLKRTERDMPESEVRPRYKVNPEFFIKAVLIILMLSGLVLFVNWVR